MHTAKITAITLTSIISLIVVGISVYLVRQYLPVVGAIWLVALGLLPIIGVCYALVYLVKLLTRFDLQDIGEFGTIGQRFTRIIEVSPQAPRMLPAPTTASGKDQEMKIDTLGDVLEKALIGVNSERFLFGYYPDNTPMYGVWDRVKSLIVAGMSGSGKTVSMVFIIVQLMLSKAAKLTVIDPHWSKPDGLTTRLKPLSAYGTFVRGNDNTRIVETIAAFRAMLERRIAGEPFDHAELLVIDEWNRIASRSKDVFDDVKWIVEEIAQEGRGFQVYVMLAGQIWMPSKSGGSSIIDSVQAVYAHRLKKNQSRFLVDAEIAKQTEKLQPGHVFFSDAYGEVERLVIPECKYRDAVTVRDMLHGVIDTSAGYPLLKTAESETAFTDVETDFTARGYKGFIPQLQLTSPSEPSQLGDKAQEVKRLRLLGMRQSDILFKLWGVRPGATKEYQDARAAYQAIVESIVRSV